MHILEVKNLKKTYTTKLGTNKVEALKDVNFTAENGEFIAVMGESGSGKTTLLNILAALDKKTSGSVIIDGNDLSGVKEAQLAKFRREKLGFVFQDFNLLDTLTVEENILLPLVLSRKSAKTMKENLHDLADSLGIAKLLKKYPYEISGGEKQRVAVARAVITDPVLILADEPTGALDSKSTDILLSIFKGLNEAKQTIVMVTHSVKCAATANRVLFIKDGVIFHELYKGKQDETSFFAKITETLTALQQGGR